MKAYINGTEVAVQPAETILEAARRTGPLHPDPVRDGPTSTTRRAPAASVWWRPRPGGQRPGPGGDRLHHAHGRGHGGAHPAQGACATCSGCRWSCSSRTTIRIAPPASGMGIASSRDVAQFVGLSQSPLSRQEPAPAPSPRRQLPRLWSAIRGKCIRCFRCVRVCRTEQAVDAPGHVRLRAGHGSGPAQRTDPGRIGLRELRPVRAGPAPTGGSGGEGTRRKRSSTTCTTRAS